MSTLTLAEAAPFFKKKNARAVRALLKADPSIPWFKAAGKILFLEADLERWGQARYSEPAKKLLQGATCTDEGKRESGKSVSQELDNLLKPPIGKERRASNTNSTTKRGTLRAV